MNAGDRFVPAIIAGMVFFLAAVLGAQPVSFSVSPSVVEIAALPGTAASAPLYVVNRSQQTLRFRASVRNLSAVEASMSAAPFTILEPSEFNVEPERTVALRTTVSVPRDAKGGKYAELMISTSASGPTREGASAVLLPTIVARLAVWVKGTEVVSAGIQRIAARSTEDGGAEVRIVFANRGNVHVWMLGELVGLDATGQRVRTVPIPSSLVLPSSTREFSLTVDSLPRPCTLRAKIDYGADVVSVGEVQLK